MAHNPIKGRTRVDAGHPGAMTAEEFCAMLARLKFDDTNHARDAGQSACARFFGYTPRVARIWATKGPPPAVAIALRLMHGTKLDAEAAALLLRRGRL